LFTTGTGRERVVDREESKSNPDAPLFLKAAHLFAGTWIEENRERYVRMWSANA